MGPTQVLLLTVTLRVCVQVCLPSIWLKNQNQLEIRNQTVGIKTNQNIECYKGLLFHRLTKMITDYSCLVLILKLYF